MSDYLTPEQQKKVIESLEKKKVTTENISNRLDSKNKDLQANWGTKTYEEHKTRFEEDYYNRWKENTKYDYKKQLESIEKIEIKDRLSGKFETQEQPEARFFWKSRRNEANRIQELKTLYKNPEQVRFDKNTVREMAAIEKYYDYHKNYFASRNNQRALHQNYLNQDPHNQDFAEKWKSNFDAQKKKYGTFFGAIKGSFASVKDMVLDGIYGDKEKNKELSRKNEMEVGLRPFFAMTKKILFWKKQVGRLGTETEEEKNDGSEYNKRILRQYTTEGPHHKRMVLDELANKLLNFELTPNMFTNKYLADNMLKMQRYTDMLTGFVELTKYNPEYLDVTNPNAAHTSPEMAALIRSRIILLQPIMSNFMTRHAKYFGYRKFKGVEGVGVTDKEKSGFNNEDEYNQFVKDTWEWVKQAYNSTTDFMDDMADMKMAEALHSKEQQAISNRQQRNKDKLGTAEDDSQFEVKYDVDGKFAEKLLEIKNRITSKPYIYELYGADLDRLFGKINEMTRRLDEVSTRMTLLTELIETSGEMKFKKVENFGAMWKTYLQKELTRMVSEEDILKNQLKNYEAAVNYLADQKLEDKNFKLTPPTGEVLNVLEFEGLNHVIEIEKAVKYNDLLYKNLDYYNFDKYKDEKGNPLNTEELWAQYHFTLLKRGMDRARLVNEMKDGKTTVEITEVSKMNNIQKRAICKQKFELAKEKAEKGDKEYNLTLAYIHNTDIEKLLKYYELDADLDITDDETYKKYFQVKCIADIGEKLSKDPSGANVEGFSKLSENQKDEIRIRTSLFKDYFKRWEGQMMYTRSEAYEYIGDTANMMGNNEIIEGIDKQYRKSTLDNISEKLGDSWEEEKDQESKNMIGELANFMYGMAIANDYKAKAMRLFCKDTYDAYKADYQKNKIRTELENLYSNDFDEMVKEGLIQGGEKEKAEYLKRVDKAINLKKLCEEYYKETQEGKHKLQIDPTLDKKDRAGILSSHYSRVIEKIKKFNTDCLNEDYILEHFKELLSDASYCADFFTILKANGNADYELLAEHIGISEKDAMALDKYEGIVVDIMDMVTTTMLDYGIRNMTGNIRFSSSTDCKRAMVRMDRKYADEFKEIDRERIEAIKTAKTQFEEDDQLEVEIEKYRKLVEEENERNRILQQNEKPYEELTDEEKKEYVVGNLKINGKVLIYKRRNKYEEQYQALLRRRRSFEQRTSIIHVVHSSLNTKPDEKVKAEELENGRKIDYIEKRKNSIKEHLQLLLREEPAVRTRNYVDELFKYLNKYHADLSLTNPEEVKQALKKAKDEWFFRLTNGARKEAEIRLAEYEKDSTSMSDFFIWKSSLESDENLAERAKVFGQDKFVKTNIKTIRNIMETIAEANASVNDIQTPEFLDKLKDNLEIKGIDERQFMFLLRKHNVGVSGLANNISDANKAQKNKDDVQRYLDVETRDQFLIEATKDVLSARKELDIDNINDEYILSHFAECYFTANKMMAFQQLYYGELDSFQKFAVLGGEEGKLAEEAIRYFDKGHGATYALYYDAVMAVANKYGVTASGSLSFGLSEEKLEQLNKEGKSNPETTKEVADNLEAAKKRAADSYNAIHTARKQNEIEVTITDALQHSLANIEVGNDLRDTVNVYFDENEVLNNKLKKFHDTHTEAYLGARNIVNMLGKKEIAKDQVSYTIRSFDYPQGLFFMAKDEPYKDGFDMLRNQEVAVNFKNLFAKDTANVGKNLSVIDKDKCDSVIKRITEMGLTKGEIGKDKNKKVIASEKYFEENFSKEFFEDMLNAMNYCIIFEADEDILSLTAYEEQISNVRGENGVLDLLAKEKKALTNASRKKEKLDRDYKALLEQEDNFANLMETDKENADIYRKSLAQVGQIREQTYKDLEAAQKEEKLRKEKVAALSASTEISNAEFISEDKLNTLKTLKKIFSDKKNRFIISTYVDLFMTYLLKMGIKVDGSLTNKEVFDKILAGRMVYKERNEEAGYSISKKEALEVGELATGDLKKRYEDTFNIKLNNITKKKYPKDYDNRIKKEKAIAKEKSKAKKK